MTDRLTRLVRVGWVDSSHDATAWFNKNEEHKFELAECESVGWVVEETDAHIVLAADDSPEQFGRVMIIPQVNVRSLVTLHDHPFAAQTDG